MGGSVRSSLGICARRRCVTSGLLRLAPLHLKTHAQTFTLCSFGQKVDVCAWVFGVVARPFLSSRLPLGELRGPSPRITLDLPSLPLYTYR